MISGYGHKEFRWHTSSQTVRRGKWPRKTLRKVLKDKMMEVFCVIQSAKGTTIFEPPNAIPNVIYFVGYNVANQLSTFAGSRTGKLMY
mmetsp:Transcript_47055/g.98549  ORF Transcript_47055/g.98549 Transcript_47055/m.98549 type:complete len:88 (-) Transcript_47055:187-450(-)